jgi:hypothetical protein
MNDPNKADQMRMNVYEIASVADGGLETGHYVADPRHRCCSGRTRWRRLHWSFAGGIFCDKRNDLEILPKGLLDYGDDLKDLLNGEPPMRGDVGRH